MPKLGKKADEFAREPQKKIIYKEALLGEFEGQTFASLTAPEKDGMLLAALIMLNIVDEKGNILDCNDC